MEFDTLILVRLRAAGEDNLWTDLELQSKREGGELGGWGRRSQGR